MKRKDSFSGGSRQEQALRLMEALSGVDEELLERAGAEEGVKIPGTHSMVKASRRFSVRYARPLAAVLCLAVVGALSWGGYQLTTKNNKSGSDYAGGAVTEEKMPDSNGEECAPEEEMEGAEAAGGEGAEALPQEEMHDEMTDLMGAESGGSTGTDGRAEKDTDGYAASGGTEGAQNQEVGMAGSQEGSSESGDSWESHIKESEGDSDTGEDTGCPTDDRQQLTEEEARDQEGLGSYLPETLPEGYLFEASFLGRDPDSGEACLSVTWTRGLDYITWRVRETADPPATLDPDKPETYDLRLYEIPYGESVPREYRESVDQPLFAREDFTRDMVAGRMHTAEDQGDTDTPRGNFSVLYEDNIIIEFSGRGTVDEIWDLFRSLEE